MPRVLLLPLWLLFCATILSGCLLTSVPSAGGYAGGTYCRFGRVWVPAHYAYGRYQGGFWRCR